MTVSDKLIMRFILDAESSNCCYAPAKKEQFHQDAKAIFREVAKLMGLNRSEYEIRSNKGGAGVSGEITLHTTGVYAQFFQSGYNSVGILYRKVNGMRDYCGKRNRWVPFGTLTSLETFAKRLRAVHDAEDDIEADSNLRKLTG